MDPHSSTRGLLWFADQVEHLGGQPLVYLPTRRSARQDHVLSYVVGSTAVVAHTWRSLPASAWQGGVVLAAWPDPARLAKIAGDPRTRALCVLASEDYDVTGWQERARPLSLGVGDERPIETDPVFLRSAAAKGRKDLGSTVAS